MSFWKRLFGRARAELVETASEILPFTPESPAAQNPHFPITLKATDYGETPPRNFVPLMAAGWTLEGSFTMWEVAEFIQSESTNYPDQCLFGIIEDLGQASYTSSHAMNSNELDDIDPETQEGLHPDSFEIFKAGEAPEFVGMRHPSEFPIRHKIFMNFVSDTGPADWHNSMMWDDGRSGCPTILVGSKKRPEVERWGWHRESLTYVMRVPVMAACEALAAFPNGYFSDDIQPEGNYALAKALEESFGLRLIGVGATYLGFMRDAPLTTHEAADFGQFLSPLFSNDPLDVGARIAKIVEGEHTIFIAYGNR